MMNWTKHCIRLSWRTTAFCYNNYVVFSPPSYYNDDEAATWRFHLSLSHTVVIASCRCMFFVSISSFMLSIYFFGCLPWFLFPLTRQCITFAGSRSLPIRDTCPNQFNLLSPILSISVVSWCSIPRTVSFLFLSRLVTFNNLLNHVISAV